MSLSSVQRMRFGMFEVDVGSGELWRNGSKIKLQDQPFQVLALLLERAGELVTREALIRTLWPDNTFVDSERGLNKAINKLRAALRDKAAKPAFIETLPQRGYRFIGALENPPAVSKGFVSSGLPRIDSLAVLPLENLSGNPAEEYFSDGLTEEMISALARISSLRVISRTSVMQYKSSRKSIPEIARELGVDAIVEGSVTRVGQKVRINAQLIGGSDDRHLWSERYDRDISDILQLQGDVARSIGTQINKLVDPEHFYPQGERQVQPQAYAAWLKGNYFRDRMNPADLLKSVECFEEAIELDPGYAKAFGDLSRSYFYLGMFGMGRPMELFPKAGAIARKALQLDESVASAHIAMAAVHIFYDWDWTSAEAESKRAVELSPGESVTHAHLADFLSITGRHDEAIATYMRVGELDPISRVYIGHFALILYRSRHYKESVEQCQKALEIDPDYVNALWFLALSLEPLGEIPDAIARLERAVSLSHGPHLLALLGRLYGMSGDKVKALEILDNLKGRATQMYVSPFDLAVVYVGLGDRESAFGLFEEAHQQRVFRIIELTMPMFDSLRSDSRWTSLVQRTGLSPDRLLD